MEEERWFTVADDLGRRKTEERGRRRRTRSMASALGAMTTAEGRVTARPAQNWLVNGEGDDGGAADADDGGRARVEQEWPQLSAQ